MSLKSRTVTGLFWSTISKVSTVGLQMALMVILARLLMPADFGLIGMAMIIISVVTLVNEQGLSAALIQKPDLEEGHLSSTFWASLGLGAFLGLATAALAPVIAAFFHDEKLIDVLRVLAVSFLFGSIGVVQRAQFHRAMDFKRVAVGEIWGSALSAVVTITMAFTGFGVWSLVAMNLVNTAVVSAYLWYAGPWRPRFIFNWPQFRELVRFSLNVMGANVVIYANTNVDYLVVGRYLGARILGFYTFAFNLITFPVYKLSSIVSKVTFPAFSNIQTDNDRLRPAYLKSVTYISLVTFPLLMGITLLAEELVHVVFGAKWLPAVFVIQVLSPVGILKSVGNTKGSVFLAKGRSDLSLKTTSVFFILLCVSLLVGVQWGLKGVAIAYTTAYVLTFPIFQHVVNSLVEMSNRRFYRALMPTAAATAIMSVVVILARQAAYAWFRQPQLLTLLLAVPAGAVSYLACIWRLRPDAAREILGNFGFRLGFKGLASVDH